MSLDVGPEIGTSIFDSVETKLDGEVVTVPGDLMEQCHEAAFEVAEFHSTGGSENFNKAYYLELQRRYDQMVRVCAAGDFVIRHMP